MILFWTSKYRSSFSTVQSPVELIPERQINPFAETTIKITSSWNTFLVQNEKIRYLTLPFFLHWSSFTRPLRPTSHSIPFSISSRASVLSLFRSCMRAFTQPLAPLSRSTNTSTKPLHQSISPYFITLKAFCWCRAIHAALRSTRHFWLLLNKHLYLARYSFIPAMSNVVFSKSLPGSPLLTSCRNVKLRGLGT